LSDPTFSDSRIPSDPIIGIRRYPAVGKRRKSKDITGFRLSVSRRIRLSDNVGFSRIRWGDFDLGNLFISVFSTAIFLFFHLKSSQKYKVFLKSFKNLNRRCQHTK